MTLQSKLLTCRCLNVQLIHDQREQPSIEKTFELLGRNQNSDQDLDQFLINSNLIQIIPAGIKIVNWIILDLSIINISFSITELRISVFEKSD